jgi:hypothetical protein
MRVGGSFVLLTGDSIEVASGHHITLARRHPQWRQPATYVKENLKGGAVLSTTYLAALYYVGQCDETYPTRMLTWEYIESGSQGLKDLVDLQAFVAAHPRGFFLAEWQRFGRWKQLAEDKGWIDQHMRRIDEASNKDVTVYAWPRE